MTELAKTRGPIWRECQKMADELTSWAQNEEMVDTRYTDAGHLMIAAAKRLRVVAAIGERLSEECRELRGGK